MDEATQKVEIYKVYVATIAAIEDRCHRAAVIYLGMLLAVATVTSSIQTMDSLLPFLLIFLITMTWYLRVQNFHNLKNVKYTVLQQLEQDFCFPAFEIEQNELGNGYNVRKRLDSVELMIPRVLFYASTSLLALYAVWNLTVGLIQYFNW
ncbi:MAG: hypothetical protein OXC19_09725 [Bryobacterales bacterium]|nr:hypothetical protein [Bryobacterales bacterium]